MKTMTGNVTSTKMANTVVVTVERLWRHPLYKKITKRNKKYLAHDELGVKVGDQVRIIETRPTSKRKTWKVVEIIENNKQKKIIRKTGKQKT